MLEKITSPLDIKKIPLKKLDVLAQEIRQRIIEVVSRNGGHLASSLGAVDLTVALHYCLNAPEDIIVWDVGHQAYAHKILTGRNKDFDTLRQKGGISGFPTVTESAYDPFTVGHSSTSVSLALGMAAARDLHKHKHKVVAVVGDGSLSGGMCFEALNNAGHLDKDLVVILNTNEMSISPNAGALSNYMNKIISQPVYNRIKDAIENFMKMRIPRIGPRLTNVAYRFEEMLKGLIVPGIFFEELGFRYFGPFNGHDIEEMIKNLKNIIQIGGPILFHVVTVKGKGYAPAESAPEPFHSASKFDIKTGKAIAAAQSNLSYTEIFGKQLLKLAKNDSRIIAITAAMAGGTGLDEFAKNYPDRFFDVGIAEQHAVTFAAGLAKGGYRPFVVIYSTFLQRSYDQIIIDVCLQNVPVVVCIDRAGIVGPDGPTHHGVFDIVYLSTLPNMVVMAPANDQEFEKMLVFAAAYAGPIAIRYPKACAPKARTKPARIVLGKSEIVACGKRVALVALGSMVDVACEVRVLLSEKNITASVVNARFAKPLDTQMLDELLEDHEFIFTLEEGSVEGGFGDAIQRHYCLAHTHNKHCAQIGIFGFPSEFITYAKRQEIFDMYGLSAQKIAQDIIVKVHKQ